MKLLQMLLISTKYYAKAVRRRLRNAYYRLVLKAMGKGCQICDNVLIAGPENISFGDQVIINEGVILQSCEGASITIGNRVALAYGAIILTGGLDLSTHIDHDTHISSPVVIKDNTWIGARAIILPGVTIGEGAGVAAGSLVTQDVGAGTLVFGVPARGIRRFEQVDAAKGAEG
jgi:acetyltransferase-like isoleucine patch superfamily enzyme